MKTFNRDSFLSELGQQLYISIYEIVIKFYVSYDSFKYYYCLYVHMVFWLLFYSIEWQASRGNWSWYANQ
jgi:hypothetical protein